MANLYWVTFRIAEVGNDDARRAAMLDAVKETTAGKWWTEPTSFVLFESSLSIDQLATVLKGAIDLDRDIVLIGMPHFKDARVIGNVEDADLFELLPFVTEA